MSSLRTSLVALLCALALIATACGGGSDSTSVATDGDTADTADAASPSSSESSDNGSSGGQESPIAELLGLPISDQDEMETYFNDLQRQAERKTAECMRAEGFEYEVVDYSALFAATSDMDPESREFVEEYGYGIASNPFEEAFSPESSGFVDPNQEYVESLTEGEREAYQVALNGELPDFSAGDDFDFEPAGCQGEAFAEVFTFFGVFEEFGDDLAEMESSYEADPRIVAATAGWSTCMSEAGYSYSDEEAVQRELSSRYDEIVSGPDAYEELDEEDTGEDGIFFGPSSLKPEYQARVDELAVEERAIALASWECNGPLREISEDIQYEYEQKFVEENGAAVRAALGE